MFGSTHVIHSEGYGPYIMVPTSCLQPIASLLSKAVIVPRENYKSLFPNQSQIGDPVLLFTELEHNLICNKFCESRHSCPLPQIACENTVTKGPPFSNATYSIHPTYECPKMGNGIVSSTKLTISRNCPLSPTQISQSLTLVLPLNDDLAIKPEGEILCANPETSDDPLIAVGAILSKAFFRLDEQPRACKSCNELCSLSPTLRKMNFAK